MNGGFSAGSSGFFKNAAIVLMKGLSMTRHPLLSRSLRRLTCCAACLALWPAAAGAADTSAAEQLARWSAQAGAPGDAARGRALFSATQGGQWSCASCHGDPPTRAGRHAQTGKTIATLAPAFNAESFTSAAKADKWFRRNCKDVLSRECSPREKADLLAWLVSL